MDRNGVERWPAASETMSRSGRAEDLDTLVTPAAVYRPGPRASPIEGLDAIRWWRAESDPCEEWVPGAEVVAVDGGTAVTERDARDSAPEVVHHLDLRIVRFITGGRCAEFEE